MLLPPLAKSQSHALVMCKHEVIKMTRCVLLDAWFDSESKKLDEKENKTKKDFITGERK